MSPNSAYACSVPSLKLDLICFSGRRAATEEKSKAPALEVEKLLPLPCILAGWEVNSQIDAGQTLRIEKSGHQLVLFKLLGDFITGNYNCPK